MHSLPPELWNRSFGVSEALELGITAAQLRSPRLAHPFWGIRAESERTGLDLIRAFAPRMPPRAFYYGTTAALLHGLPLPPRLKRKVLPLHIAVMAGQRRVVARGVTAHHVTIDPDDIETIDGLRVTTVERTWCDLAATGVTLAELVAAGDAALWRRDPKTHLRRIRAATARYEGRRGARLIRDAVPLLTDRSDSPPESELRVAFIQAGLPRPLPNYQIRHLGRLVATPDLTWPERRVLVEYEGEHHLTDARQWAYDIERYARLTELGWTVIRATAADYRDPAKLIARVARALTTAH
ncbi:MAG: hypothetical protein KF761_06065 [Salinibacterium sp.]|nr:hypothetical protein [Salinibacterium sp.]